MTAQTQQPQRPLSPFMLGSYYRFQLTSLLSILHRAAGVVIVLGTLGLTLWLIALAYGPDSYAFAAWLADTLIGKIVMVCFSYALLYHLCNGIRHLFWDAGYGYEIRSAYIGGYFAVAASIILTVVLWIVAWCI